MKLDIDSFFMSIDKEILYFLTLELIDRHKRSNNWKSEMADLAGRIIFHQPPENYVRKGNPYLAKLIPEHKSLLTRPKNKGLPIGNYTSQFFANLYLNKLDHFVKRYLKCHYYIRYVDDCLLLSKSREEFKYFRDQIDKFLRSKLKLKLNFKKIVIQPIALGVDLLGYFLKLGKIYLRRSVTKRYKNKLWRAAVGLEDLAWSKALAIAASYRGQAKYFN